jgi:hypothetical protein
MSKSNKTDTKSFVKDFFAHIVERFKFTAKAPNKKECCGGKCKTKNKKK